MGEAVSTYVFEEAERPLRVILRDGEPWFVAKDVCVILEIEQPTRAVEPLDDDEKGVSSTHTPGGDQEMLIVSEAGLYTLILRSRQATTAGTVAHRFRRWVTHEVLPQIRRTGSYAPDPTEGWDWQANGAKIQIVREARLTLGRKAASVLWRRIGLPMAEDEAAKPRTPSLYGVDFVKQFLEERTVEDGAGRVSAGFMMAEYSKWAATAEAPAMTQTAFGRCLTELGIERSRGVSVTYLGFRLKHISELLG